MNDKSYSLKTRKILRFCKENNLYWYLQNKFKNIEFLNSVLHYSSFEDSLIEIFTFLPYGYKHSFKSVNINVNFYNKKWKTFVKDCILQEHTEFIFSYPEYYSSYKEYSNNQATDNMSDLMKCLSVMYHYNNQE